MAETNGSIAFQNVRTLHRISNALCKIRNQQLAEFRLTAVQSDVVIFLARHQKDMDEINQLDIQAHLQLSNPTVSGILNRLEEKGFIYRRQSSKDARFKCVLMTEKAFELAVVAKQQLYSSEELLVVGMSEEEKSDFSKYLAIVLKNLDTELEKPEISRTM